MDKCGVVDTLLISSQFSQERVKSLFVINESFVKFRPAFARLTLDGDNWSLAFHFDEMKVHFSVYEDHFPVCQDWPMETCLVCSNCYQIQGNRGWEGGTVNLLTELDHWLSFHFKTCPLLSQRMESQLKLALANCFLS